MGNQILACFGQLTWLFSRGRPSHMSSGGIEGTNYAASCAYSSTQILEAHNPRLRGQPKMLINAAGKVKQSVYTKPASVSLQYRFYH